MVILYFLVGVLVTIPIWAAGAGAGPNGVLVAAVVTIGGTSTLSWFSASYGRKENAQFALSFSAAMGALCIFLGFWGASIVNSDYATLIKQWHGTVPPKWLSPALIGLSTSAGLLVVRSFLIWAVYTSKNMTARAIKFLEARPLPELAGDIAAGLIVGTVYLISAALVVTVVTTAVCFVGFLAILFGTFKD